MAPRVSVQRLGSGISTELATAEAVWYIWQNAYIPIHRADGGGGNQVENR